VRRRKLYLTTHNSHNRQTSLPPGGIRTHSLSRRAAVVLRLRPRDRWDRVMLYIQIVILNIVYTVHRRTNSTCTKYILINSTACFGISHVPLWGNLRSCYPNALKCASVSCELIHLSRNGPFEGFVITTVNSPRRWHVWCAETFCTVDNVFNALEVGPMN